MNRWIVILLAVVLGANGLAMNVAPLAWYDAVPGVTATGAYNPHFVRDIGMAYLVVSLGLAWFAWRPVQGWPALVCAAAFQLLHAAIHVGDGVCGANPLSDFARDFPGVFLPALLTVWVVWRARPTHTGA